MNVLMRKAGNKRMADVTRLVVRKSGDWLTLSKLPPALAGAQSCAEWEIDGVRYVSNTVQTGPVVRVRLVRA